ncbi:hypothetical protein [Leifsonia aquatica]|uniref:hypothetical protein n=1 Tax=Leifsonia aquatica TaxID=144185 RepID=UPI0028A96BE5|nr:hypothetical protein [Leifsonia aquatica]
MTETPLEPPADYAGQVIDAELHLLDRQILDRDDLPVATVDDLELSDIPLDEAIEPGTPAPVIENLLSGSALWTRMFGGRPPRSRLHRIPWSDVARVDIVVSLGVPGEELDVTWVERWARDHIVARIPRGRHDPE